MSLLFISIGGSMNATTNSFWGDFNAALWDVFETTEGRNCLAHEASYQHLFDQRFEAARRNCNYPAYDRGTTVSKLEIVCHNLMVASFVQRELRSQLHDFLPGAIEEATPIINEINLSEPEEGKIVINIPFKPLMLFVQASLTRTVFLRFSVGNPEIGVRGQCNILGRKVTYNNGSLMIEPALKRLQVGRGAGCREIEVDLTASLVYLFAGGRRCQGPKSISSVYVNVSDRLVDFFKISRSKPTQIYTIVQAVLSASSNLHARTARAQSDEVEDEEVESRAVKRNRTTTPKVFDIGQGVDDLD